MIANFTRVSPLKVLDQSVRGRLGPGHLGVLIARAGVGKTACLIHIALDKVFKGERLVHVSLNEGPEKVSSYYNVIFHDLLKALEVRDDNDSRTMVDRNRMILAYLNESFDMGRLRANLTNLRDRLTFQPETMIVDGLDFEAADRPVFEAFKQLAVDFDMEIWFSALSHRHITTANERGIPYPCHATDDLFSLIIRLNPTASGTYLELLKDHERWPEPGTRVRLDPITFLAME
jgi:hypothetical protein